MLFCHSLHQVFRKFNARRPLFQRRTQNFRAFQDAAPVGQNQIRLIDRIRHFAPLPANLDDLRIGRHNVMGPFAVNQFHAPIHGLFHCYIVKADPQYVDPHVYHLCRFPVLPDT